MITLITSLIGIFLMGSVFLGFYRLMKDTAYDIKQGDSTFGQKAGFFYILVGTIVCVVGFLFAWATGRL